MSLAHTVGELVVQKPSRARVFEHFGIDYCCGGNLPLAEACSKKGVDVEAVRAALAKADAAPNAGGKDWSTATMGEIVAHVEAVHHAYLRREMPRLEFLTGRVADRHEQRHPELRKIHEIFLHFKQDMDTHMLKEERVLFPMCRELDHATSALSSPVGSVNNPVRMMIEEHEAAGAELEQLRELTHGYVPPADACNTYHAMLTALSELEADTHVHVHMENSILFPKAIAAEARLAACSA